MKIDTFDEPLLEFGTGTHLCPRAGIAMHSAYDTRMAVRRERILVGAVGITDHLTKLMEWLDRCSRPIPGKMNSTKPNLFPGFCGFNRNIGFKAEFIINDEITRSLSLSEVRRITKTKNRQSCVNDAVELYYRQVEFLAQNRAVDVIICILPSKLYGKIVREGLEKAEIDLEEEQLEDDILEANFRRALKAKTMHLGKPIQIMRDLSLESNPRTQQDDATKAWNFCTALYYKANQTVPWKLITNVNRPPICFVGIGFYRSRDGKSLHTSLAQVFDELGNGVILRGTPVKLDREDRTPHLTEEQASTLLERALCEYQAAMDNLPGRIVVHKSSNFNELELQGFRNATDQARVKSVDFVTVMETKLRLLRGGIYPPFRGTYIELDATTHILYTRGSVNYYQTYPGKYVPQPLEIRIVESDESPGLICREILGLTKMNWNNTQFDGKYPITIECARKVGQIMKYVDENEKPQIRYSFYM